MHKLGLVRFALRMLLLLIVGTTAIHAQEVTQSAEAAEGAALFEAGDYEAAVTPLERAAFADPTDIETLRRYLVASLYSGLYTNFEYPSNLLRIQDPDAFSELAVEAEARVQDTPDDVNAAIVAALFAVENGDPAQQDAIDRVFALDPDSAAGYSLQAYSYIYAGDNEAAREPAERAVELAVAAGDVQTLLDTGYQYAWAFNEPERALELINQAIALDPQLARAYLTRSRLYATFLDDLDSALADMNRAIELQPDNFQLYNSRGQAYLLLGEYELAYEDGVYGLNIFPASPSAVLNLIESSIASEGTLSIQPYIDTKQVFDADAPLTVDAPYTGEIVARRLVALPIEADGGTYTITVRATDPTALNPLLVIANTAGGAIAFNDDIDGGGVQSDGAFDSQATITLEADETYTAYIAHSGAVSEGTFTVTLEVAE